MIQNFEWTQLRGKFQRAPPNIAGTPKSSKEKIGSPWFVGCLEEGGLYLKSNRNQLKGSAEGGLAIFSFEKEE